MSEPTRYEALVTAGPEGPALYLNNYRIAGSKPWGGGTFIAEWKGWTVEDLFAAIPDLRALRESHAELLAVLKTWAGLFGEACGECDPCGWGDGDCVHWPLIQSTAAAIQKAEAINGDR